jgi:hypothetical protein
MQTYVKNALCYDEFVNRKFLLFKKRVSKDEMGKSKSLHQNLQSPLYIVIDFREKKIKVVLKKKNLYMLYV